MFLFYFPNMLLLLDVDPRLQKLNLRLLVVVGGTTTGAGVVVVVVVVVVVEVATIFKATRLLHSETTASTCSSVYKSKNATLAMYLFRNPSSDKVQMMSSSVSVTHDTKQTGKKSKTKILTNIFINSLTFPENDVSYMKLIYVTFLYHNFKLNQNYVRAIKKCSSFVNVNEFLNIFLAKG